MGERGQLTTKRANILAGNCTIAVEICSKNHALHPHCQCDDESTPAIPFLLGAPPAATLIPHCGGVGRGTAGRRGNRSVRRRRCEAMDERRVKGEGAKGRSRGVMQGAAKY